MMWNIIRLIAIILLLATMFLCQYAIKDIYGEVSCGIMAIILLHIEMKGGAE